MALLEGGGQTAVWPFRLQWEHSGLDTTQFQACVVAGCVALAAERSTGEGPTWTAPLPMLPEGRHAITLYACNIANCTAGTPTLLVEVVRSRAEVLPETPAPVPSSPPVDPPSTPPPPYVPGGKAPPRHPPRP